MDSANTQSSLGKTHNVVRNNSPRLIFEVIIDKQTYGVYSREIEHEGLNGEPTHWWLYYHKREEGQDFDPQYWKPYHSWINRHLWEINFKQFNYTKEKWGDTNFRNVTTVQMICNGKLVYEFSTTGTRDGLAYAMAKVQYLQVALAEHPYDFFNPEKEHGRKIWWYGLPATIEPRKSSPWEITVHPDLSTGITEEFWWKELFRRESKLGKVPDEDDADDLDDFNETRADGYINWGDAFSDQHIKWFRD